MSRIPCKNTKTESSTSVSYRFAAFPTIDAAGEDWDRVAPPDNIFLQRTYLRILEYNPPLDMRFAYLVYYKNDEPIGLSYCQIKEFRAGNNLPTERENPNNPCFFTGVAKSFTKWVASKISADILINGNLLLSGEHGIHFIPGKISEQLKARLLEESWASLTKSKGKEGAKMPVTLVKDMAEKNRTVGQRLKDLRFVEFEIQPCMVFDSRYESFDDYLQSMTTKYRTRAKRAFKKGRELEKRELSLVEIQQYLDRIYSLYCDIARNADFNMVDLNIDYLPALKRDLGDRFQMFGYFKDGELLAFYTTIRNDEELEAHFLGYDKEYNHDMQLYLNILYDIIRIGIELKLPKIVFARTALEIKSSVGAVPARLFCYLRHHNSITNKFTRSVLDYMKPDHEWKPRHPFKEKSTEKVQELI